MTYPSDVIIGEEASVVGNRLLLIDPRGEIDENDLLEFMERHIEPAFWKWWEQKEAMRRAGAKGVVRAMQAETTVAEEVQPVEVRDVPRGPEVYLINCWHCGGQIAWRTDLGFQGSCPYCGALIQLTI